MEGVAEVELKLFGPVQLYVVPDTLVLAVRLSVVPAHKGLLALTDIFELSGLSMRMSLSLSRDVSAWFDDMTRIRYPVPFATVFGMTQVIVPVVSDAKVPMAVGEAKLPDASDSCAVKTLPEFSFFLTVMATCAVSPVHKTLS